MSINFTLSNHNNQQAKEKPPNFDIFGLISIRPIGTIAAAALALDCADRRITWSKAQTNIQKR